MADKAERADQAEKHLKFVNGVFASETAESIANAVIYEDGDGRSLSLGDPAYERTDTFVTTQFVPSSLKYALGKTAVLDAGSFIRPGGGYLQGMSGTEQILCSQSNLFPILQGLKDRYYNGNRSYQCGQLFTDRALFIPDVVFLSTGGNDKRVDTLSANVIVVSAPNRARAIENHRSERECDNCLKGRIETVLHITAANECQTLICGALGFGRDGYEPKQIAEIFKNWIDDNPGIIGRVIFSVPRVCTEAFYAAFGNAPLRRKVTDTSDKTPGDEEDDEEDFRNIELPEGVTLR